MKKLLILMMIATLLLTSVLALAEESEQKEAQEVEVVQEEEKTPEVQEQPTEENTAAPSEEQAAGPDSRVADEQSEVAIDLSGKFFVHAKIPEGYTFDGDMRNGIVFVGHLLPKDGNNPVGLVTVAFDEEANGRSIGDLTEEEVKGLVAMDTSAIGEHVEAGETITSHGTRVLVYKVLDPEEARYEMYTIYKGYQIGMLVLPGGSGELNNAQLDWAIGFLSEVWIDE